MINKYTGQWKLPSRDPVWRPVRNSASVDDQVLNVHFGYKRNFSQHAEWIRNYIDTTQLHPLPNYITVVESSVYFT